MEYPYRKKKPSIWDLLPNDIGANDLKDNLVAGNEVATAIADSLVNLPVQGFNTLLGLPAAGVNATVDSNERIAGAMTRQPQSPRGQEMMANMGQALAPVAEFDSSMRDNLGNALTINGLPDEVNGLLYAGGTVIPEIAESLLGLRMAKGMLNTQDIPSKFRQAGAVGSQRVQPKGQSKAEAEAEGWKHPIGVGKNLKTHMDDMSYEIDSTANLSPEIKRTPDDLLNMTGVYTAGDRSRTGGNLTSVNGEELPAPVRMEGGPDYARDMNHPFAWASKDSVMGNLDATVQGAKGRGSQALGIYAPMQHKAMDFNTMTTDAALGLAQRDMSPTSKKKFDVEMRKAITAAQNQKKPLLTGVKWGGLNDPATLEKLNTLGDLRHAFMSTLKKTEFQNMQGSPDLPSIRHAITKPELLNIREGDIGQSMSLLDGGLVKDSPDGHTTYNTSMYGSDFGGLETPSTVEKMFPSILAHRRLVGGDIAKDYRSIDLKKPWQLFDRQTIQGMKGEPLADIEGSSTGERTPFVGGGHLAKLNEEPYSVKQQYEKDLGEFNPYEAAGFDVDKTHDAIGAWSENGATQYNPVRVEKPVFKGGLLDNIDDATAIENYKGLVNVQAGSPINTQQRVPANEANALRFNFRQEPTVKDIENMSLLASENDMHLSPSGFGRYSLLNGNPDEILGDNMLDIINSSVGRPKTDNAKGIKGFMKGGQSAIVEPVRSTSEYIDLETELGTQDQGNATAKALKAWEKSMPRIEKLLEDPAQSAYIMNKMEVDAKTARDIGDITREDYNNLYSILSNPDLSGKAKIKKLMEGVKNGGLPAAGIFSFGEDE